jgi:hypothetical protein
MSERILVNGIRTPDGTEIFSRSRHDYVTYRDKNGEEYMVDGGLDYQRRSGSGGETDISVYATGEHEHDRQYFHWGTRGKDGKSPLKYKPLCDLDTDHIHAILDTQTHIDEYVRGMMESELEFRAG